MEKRAKKKTGKFNFGYIVAIAFLLCSLFFVSPSFTGNAIGEITEQGSSLLSIILFVAGVGTFVFFKIKSKV